MGFGLSNNCCFRNLHTVEMFIIRVVVRHRQLTKAPMKDVKYRMFVLDSLIFSDELQEV